MSRTALKLVLFLTILTVAWNALEPSSVVSPHMNPGLTPGSCSSCHRGHGESRSPMLRTTQAALCLSCHGTLGDRDREVALGNLSANANPPLLANVLALPFQHPLDISAFSQRPGETVTCTSCHSPHRGSVNLEGNQTVPGRRMSTRNPAQFEFELCQECHGSQGAATQDLTDISRLLSPQNRSYHPVESPSIEGSPSVRPDLAGKEINCTDCHGNSDPNGPRGIHGSSTPYLLRHQYATTDGNVETATTYELCYQCHSRQSIIESPLFPEHQEHIVDELISCASCHNAHGSVMNRALVRFGEETSIGAVSPSMSTGRLEFVSDGPGSGACYLTCHGEDHGPEAYGAMKFYLQTLKHSDQARTMKRPSSSKNR